MKAAAILVLAALPVAAQPKRLVHAHVQTRVASGGLAKEIQALMAAQPQPSWAGYVVAAARGRNFGCDHYWRDHEFAIAGGVVHLEPPAEVMVLLRFHNNQVSQIRTLAPDCEISAGGVPFHWLTGVQPADSVAALSSFVKPDGRLAEAAIGAIGLHAGAAADSALETFLKGGQPERVRERAARWIGSTRGRRGLEVLQRLLNSEPGERMRRSAIQAIASSAEPAAQDALAGAARGDRAAPVRVEALRLLARKGGSKALAEVQRAIGSDADREVRRRALSALKSFPDGEGIPHLIQTARAHADAEMRKHAMRVLGETRDPRAAAFFESMLSRN